MSANSEAAARRPRRWLALLPLAAFAVVAALLFVRLNAGDPSKLPSALIGHPPAPRSPARVRMKVLRRDGYRCRGCARPGDEITLQVCLVRLHSERLWALTLCPSCQRRAAEVEAGLITVAEGQYLRGRVPAEARLESVRHFSRTA